MPVPLSPDVTEFARAHLRSLEDLQVLLTCMDTKDRWWSVNAICRELGLTKEGALAAMDHLVRRNLLDIRVTDDVRYQFKPGSPAVEQAARAFSAAYRSSPLAIIKLVTATGGQSLRDFANAFRIRHHDDT